MPPVFRSEVLPGHTPNVVQSFQRRGTVAAFHFELGGSLQLVGALFVAKKTHVSRTRLEKITVIITVTLAC